MTTYNAKFLIFMCAAGSILGCSKQAGQDARGEDKHVPENPNEYQPASSPSAVSGYQDIRFELKNYNSKFTPPRTDGANTVGNGGLGFECVDAIGKRTLESADAYEAREV